MIWPFSQDTDPVASAYRQACKQRPEKDIDVADLTVVALDAETTGFKIGVDRLLSLATIEIRQREVHVASARNWLIYQKDAPINEAIEVHGILPSDTAEGRPEKEVIGELLGLIGNSVIIGHHIRFDMEMLNEAARRHFKVKLKNRVIDTASLAQQELPAFHRTGYANQPPPKLEEVCSNLGLDMIDRHTALGDTFTTALIFLTLCARIRQRLGRPVRFADLPLSKF
ncbi:3'-5' exonuclease [Pelagicoccus sp. SDUM812003]|uniref:3'-5' exonuclease n=1 Tax=Pelagicoccus sp. SDUM812003 TaxID=3041267 RepID=UPI00280F657D|nr:3'-5' exonuclease [Pelagicoccus sp. SDUM812003]MDQ8202868.1 3'-5' exonuclease [Pelagicoccus sp. SDUM812003]